GYRDSIESVESGGTFGPGPRFVAPRIEVNAPSQMAIQAANHQLIGRLDYLESQLGEVQLSIKSLQTSKTHHSTRLVSHSGQLSAQNQARISEADSLRIDMGAMEERLVESMLAMEKRLVDRLDRMDSSNGTFFQRIIDSFSFFKRSS
ncbi:hypothetical protein P692DRAFT_20761253, partial [Suillus brevipes Sb2]